MRQLLARRGTRVAIVDRASATALDTAELIVAEGGEPVGMTADIESGTRSCISACSTAARKSTAVFAAPLQKLITST